MMKKLLSFFFLVIFIFLSWISSDSLAYDKLSIVERFTNASCVPCANLNNSWYNAVTHELVNSGAIAHIIYNGWWPGPNDPMYLLNLDDNTARINYYGVNAVPWIDVNGSTISTSEIAMRNAVNTGNAAYSPFQIEVTVNEFSQTLLKYTVKITRDPDDNTTFGSNVKLRFGLTEKTIQFSSPPGSNGESVFYSVCRKMLPDATGSLFTIPDPGQSTQIELQYVPTSQFLSSVNLDSIRVVAYIQNDDNKSIYQSYMGVNYESSIASTSSDILGDNTDTGEYTTSLYNSGMMDDNYEVHVTMNAPNGWTGDYTTPNGTFTFDQVDNLSVPSNSIAEISVTANPNGIDGYGEIVVQFYSPGAQSAATAILRFTTKTGLNALVVDGGEGYSDYIDSSMQEAFGDSYGIVSRSALDQPDVDLSHFYLLAWTQGTTLPAFYPGEVNALQAFLDGGGNLFINGQDIGSDIFKPTGQSQFAQDFYHNYLHADFVKDTANGFYINGIAGDPIGDGVSFILYNTIHARSHDQISAYDAYATPIFQVGTSGSIIVGLKSEASGSRVVYSSIGVEQMPADVRDTVTARSLRWLMENVVVGNEENTGNQPNTFSLDQNYPNPFNPTTKIKYSIPSASRTTLKVYDILGMEVATLVNSEKPAGTYEVDFNASVLSSGVYFYKLQSGANVQTKKMIVLK